MKAGVKNGLLIAIVICLIFVPFVLKKDSRFAGADDQAKNAIAQIDPGYIAWFHPFWQPPGSEAESFLFALQAAAGSGFVFYYIGYIRGKSAGSKEDGKKRD